MLAAPKGLIDLLTLARDESDGDDRKWVQDVLLILIAYLRAIGVDPELLQPLRDLLYALLDADAGVRNDLIQRLSRKGRPRKKTSGSLEVGACCGTSHALNPTEDARGGRGKASRHRESTRC
jgi:hypothetical protein